MTRGRYELKYHIRLTDFALLSRRLPAVMQKDPNAGPAGYHIASLYFEDIYHRAWHQKLDGVDERAKYRIRIYNGSDDVLKLECKSRKSGFVFKKVEAITRGQYDAILAGDYSWITQGSPPLFKQFRAAAANRLRPAVVVEYDRLAFVDKGDARVSFDSCIMASTGAADLFSPHRRMCSATAGDLIVMEIKFATALPVSIARLLADGNVQQQSISKYILCMDTCLGVKHYG